MQTVRIKCPGCQTVLEVKNSQGLPAKQFNCPRCGKNLKVLFKADVTDNNEKTQLKLTHSSHTLCLLSLAGRIYELNDGMNIVGRRSASSTADVQLDTTDGYMSRRHVKINVTKITDSSIRADISNAENKNATYVNGHLLSAEDVIVLHDGDMIRMGNTEIQVKMSK